MNPQPILNEQQWSAWAQNFQQFAGKDTPYKSPFTVQNKTPDAIEILIYDQIGKDFWSGEGMVAKEFSDLLKDVNPNATLTVGILSPGGNVHEGDAISAKIEQWKGHTITRNDGMAASIASRILQAGKERQSSPSAKVMIHKASGAIIGNSDDAKKFGEILQKYDQSISETYARRSGVPAEHWMNAMTAVTYYTAEEAKAAGLIDKILGEKSTKNLAAGNQVTQNAQTTATANPSATPIVANHQTEPMTPAAVPLPAAQPPQAIQNNTKPNNTMETKPETAAVTPAALDTTVIVNAIKDGFASLQKTQTVTANQLPGTEPVRASGIELGVNAAVQAFNTIERGTPRFREFVTNQYATLKKELPGAGIYNANTVDSGLANSILSSDAIQTMRTYFAPFTAFSRKVELSPLSKRQVINVPLISSAGSMQTNATNYETGDTTAADVAVTVNEYSKSFTVSRAESNLGLALAQYAPTNALVLAEGVAALISAKMTNALFGADNVIGAATDFDANDLRAVLALGKNFKRNTLLLDGGHLAYLLPTDRTKFAFGEPGAYGFDGGIYKNNLWTGGATDICGFLCGPDALAIATGPAAGLPAGEAMEQSSVDVGGITLTTATWFSRATHSFWGAYYIMFGVKEGDTTQGKVLTTQ